MAAPSLEKSCKSHMPKFVHELAEAKVLFETLGVEKNLLPLVVEKDYWVMHCFWPRRVASRRDLRELRFTGTNTSLAKNLLVRLGV